MTKLFKNKLNLTNTCFTEKTAINTVDLGNVKWTDNSMALAFSNCTNLTGITNISNSVTNMCNTFYGCTNLTNVPAISNNVTNMALTFYGCTNLTDMPDMMNANNVTNMYSTFSNCTNLTNTSIIPNSITNMYRTFYACTSLVNVPVIPNSVTNMTQTFLGCTSLVNAPTIPNSVTDMTSTFQICNNLVNVPDIPNSVTNMSSTFGWCNSLVNAPVISNSVTNMRRTFWSCISLVNAPVIPNSVTFMGYTFCGCTNLTGDIYIYSNQINYAIGCFGNTSLIKNVYIPFTNSDGSTSETYSRFISAGYKTDGSREGVYLKDINAKTQYTLTINPTPSDATVVLTAEGYTQSGNCITVEENTSVLFNVSKDGYVTQSGTRVVTKDETMTVVLEKQSTDEACALNSTVAAYNVGDSIYVNDGMAVSNYVYTAYPCEDAYKNDFTIIATITAKRTDGDLTIFEFERTSGPSEYTVTMVIDQDDAGVDYINGEAKTVNVIASEDNATVTTSTTLTKSTNTFNAIDYINYNLTVNPALSDNEITLVIGGQKVEYSSLPVLVKKGTYAYYRINKEGYNEVYNVFHINDLTGQKVTLTAK